MARDGELAEPRRPAPPGLRTVLGFTRMSKAAYAIVRRALDDDEPFRSRVAAAAEESEVGRAGWLWLHRPNGWETDAALETADDDHDAGRGLARLRRERDGAEAAAARHRGAATEAHEARRRAEAQLGEARQQVTGARTDVAGVRRRLEVLEVERNQAMRTQKALEADLAAARRDLKVAREATRQAEAELMASTSVEAAVTERTGLGAPPPEDAVTGGAGSDRAGTDRARSRRPAAIRASVVDLPGAGFDQRAAQDAVTAASGAAAALARALADAAAALASAPQATDREGDHQRRRSGNPAPAVRNRPGQGRSGRARRRVRIAPTLPPATFEGSAAANRHLVASGGSLLLIDGYNLARAAWSGLEPEEERRRTIALLEEVRARSGALVTVVFDGEDHTVAPPASRSVRVQFSATEETADEAIAELLATIPLSQPVVVVSSDREVADDARRQGAAVLGALDFLTAARR